MAVLDGDAAPVAEAAAWFASVSLGRCRPKIDLLGRLSPPRPFSFYAASGGKGGARRNALFPLGGYPGDEDRARELFARLDQAKCRADFIAATAFLKALPECTGRVGVVIDNGCLFRGGKEKATRTGIIADDLLEAVILLPEKLFYNTGAPGAIIILNKSKPKKRSGKILFINASKEFEQHPEVRKLNRLGKENIDKITTAYRQFKDTDGFSRVVDHDKIKENDYNLNVTLYVFPEEEAEEIDVEKEWKEIRAIEEDLAKVSKKIEGYLEELKQA